VPPVLAEKGIDAKDVKDRNNLFIEHRRHAPLWIRKLATAAGREVRRFGRASLNRP
jgi:hypothetical protein